MPSFTVFLSWNLLVNWSVFKNVKHTKSWRNHRLCVSVDRCFFFVQIALMMLVDNALNSALYNVWNWDNGVMLLVDSVFPFQVAQGRIRNVKPRHSYLVFEQKFIFRPVKGWILFGPQTVQQWNLRLFVCLLFFLPPLVFCSVTFLMHSFILTLKI